MLIGVYCWKVANHGFGSSLLWLLTIDFATDCCGDRGCGDCTLGTVWSPSKHLWIGSGRHFPLVFIRVANMDHC